MDSLTVNKDKESKRYSVMSNIKFLIDKANIVKSKILFSYILIGVVSSLITTIEMLIAPTILNKIETNMTLSILFLYIGIFSISLLVCTAIKTYLKNYNWYQGFNVRMSFIFDIAKKWYSSSYQNLLDTKFKQSYDKAMTDVSNPSAPTEAIWTSISNITENFLGIIIYSLIITKLNVFLIILIIITSVISFLFTKKVNKWNYNRREIESEIISKIFYIKGIGTKREYAKEAKVFGFGNWIEDLWNKTMEAYSDFLKKKYFSFFSISFLDVILTFLRNAIAYYYLVKLTLDNNLLASEFLLYFGAISGFSVWVQRLLDNISLLIRQATDIATTREFLQWRETFNLDEGNEIERDINNQYEIKLDNVSYIYPNAENYTIKNMNLTLNKGEKLAIVGLNGAGKTTLVKLLCGFLDPTEGRVLLNGVDIKSYKRLEYYKLISAVYQDFSIIDTTVSSNVSQSLDDIDLDRVKKCIDMAGLSKKIESLPKGYDTILGRHIYDDGVELSGGQNQRLMLARALYKNAPIMVLDEPTAALDPIAENDIYLKYNEMSENKTSLFISHRLASTRFCDRIVLLNDGQIIEEGNHEELIEKNSEYAKLFNVQRKYYEDIDVKVGEISE